MSKLEIPFSLDEKYSNEDEYMAIRQKRFAFWTSSVVTDWFLKQGYTLYKRKHFEEGFLACESIPTHPSPDYVEAQYPYAYHDNFSIQGRGEPLLATEQMGKVLFAQDSQGHHVAIKLVPDNSDELRILRFVHSQSFDVLKEHCLLPIIDFIPLNNFWLVVMPRWGTAIHLPGKRVRDVLDIMRSMLKALAFLHSRNILNRDLKLSNMAVNHFSDDSSLPKNPTRAQLEKSNSVIYGMFDFDLSIIVPTDVDKHSFRLPYQMSWDGTFSEPRDTAQGEFDYDPFAFDVGTLGRQFCETYQHLTQYVPMLAPFLDRMVTRNIPSRFTADGALQFLEEFSPQLTESELEQICPPREFGFDHETYDRWQHLSPEFKRRWAAFREPRVSMMMRIIRRICETGYMVHLVPWIRRFCYTLWTNPRDLLVR